MRKDVQARAIRWAIWLISFIAAGATKPLFFPEGGLRYFLVGASVILVGHFVGVWIEARIVKT